MITIKRKDDLGLKRALKKPREVKTPQKLIVFIVPKGMTKREFLKSYVEPNKGLFKLQFNLIRLLTTKSLKLTGEKAIDYLHYPTGFDVRLLNKFLTDHRTKFGTDPHIEEYKIPCIK